MEEAMRDRMVLVTQNVDGLHLRAGSSAARTWQIHGNLHYTRCSNDCDAPTAPVPADLDEQWAKDRRLTTGEAATLRCACGGWRRPFVLWFDETYDEENFRFDSTLGEASRTDLLVVIGTSGATSLPIQMAQVAAQRGVPSVVIDPQPNPFAQMGPGWFLQAKAGALVPLLADEIVAATS